MKKIALLLFGTVTLIWLSPLTLAAAGDKQSDWGENVCQFGEQYVSTHADTEPGPEPGFWDKLEEDLHSQQTACGEINKVTQSLEKSDCNVEGKVITEISEAFAGETSTDGGDNFVKTVYHGVCCLEPVTKTLETPVKDKDGKVIRDTETVCQESRDIYTESQDSCEALGGLGCEERQWIIGSTGAGIVKVYVKQLYVWSTGIVGFIAVTIMVISGIQISFSGIAGSVDSARKRLVQSISGIVLLFLSGLLLYTINPTFFS